MLQRLVLILGVVAFAGVAAAEPSSRPLPPQPFKSLFPIEGAAGGLIGKRTP